MKQKVKKVTKTMMVLIITCSILLVSLIGLTVAYFTDNKSYTGTLEFGNVKLKVTDGSDVEMTDGGKIPFTFGEGREDATKLMPGDTVTINFKVSLQDNSEPAYYLVSLTDTKGVFASNTYFSDGTNSYRVDTTANKVYKIATDGSESEETTKKVGELNTSEDKHEFTIKAEIDPAYETQGGKTEVSLNIFAIQQANLVKYDADNQDKSAYHILTNKINLAVNGVDFNVTSDQLIGVMDANYKLEGGLISSAITDLLFLKTSQLDKSVYVEEMSDKEQELATMVDHNHIKMYQDSTKKKVAFVSDYKINAPLNCSFLFGKEYAGIFSGLNVVNMNLSNLNTEKVTSMNGMFIGCSNLTSLDLSNFDTRNVTNMNGMFRMCKALADLDVTSFKTEKVTSMNKMFHGCSSLTNLDLSNFDTSKVTDMVWMFTNCSKLTSLDLSNFDTSNVTNMNGMFNYCSNLTNLNLSNFDTSNVTDMSSMFNNTFSNSPSTSTLTIGDKFVIDGSNTFDKATLNTRTSFDTTVTLKRGTTTVD